MKKTKRYADGGGVNAQAPTYPFGVNNPSTPAMPGSQGSSGMNQTFNITPTAQSGQPQAQQTPQPSNFKSGGKVKSASARADGCCVRGRTRA